MFLSTFASAFEGSVHGGRRRAALAAPPRLAAGRLALKSGFISQRMFWKRNRSEFKKCRGEHVSSLGKGIRSHLSAACVRGERRFTLSAIYFRLFSPPCCVSVGCLCAPCLSVSICQCVRLSWEMHNVDRMYFYTPSASGVGARWLQIN